MTFNNERDVEVPALLAFVAARRPRSLLDVGAHWSHAHYARELRALVGTYHGIDVLDDPQTAAILDNYFVGNVLDTDLPQVYDCVTSLSTLEHCGISTYRAEDYRRERDRVFGRCLRLASRFFWHSFPVGPAHLIQGQYATIDGETLDRWTDWAEPAWRVALRFFVYRPDTDDYAGCGRAEAFGAEYPPRGKCPALCVMEGVRCTN